MLSNLGSFFSREENSNFEQENKAYGTESRIKTFSDNQGKLYEEKIQENVKKSSKNIKLLENFSERNNDPVDIKNRDDLKLLLELSDNYEKLKSDYSKNFNVMMDSAQKYIKRQSPDTNQYLNKNIRMSNGEIGYVTKQGVYKPYGSMGIYNSVIGKRNCPNTMSQLTINRSGNSIPTNPPLKLGSNMKNGQSCGFEGENVYVADLGQTTETPRYVGCYKASLTNGMVLQTDMGNNADVSSCKERAYDSGNPVFAVSGGGPGKSQCYVGKNLTGVQSAGQALLDNGKSVCATVGNETYASNTQPVIDGLKFIVCKGYFKDNPSFFDKATIISSGYSSKFGDVSQATNKLVSTSTKDVISVQWTGYFKPNVSGIWKFHITTDDAGYMWLGDVANVGYNTSNAFAKIPGSHGMKKSNVGQINVVSGKSYPIRAQFGNGGGPLGFKMGIIMPNGLETNDGTNLFYYQGSAVNALATYTINEIANTSNLGKTGYITEDGNIREYPSNMIKKTNTYIEIGNYNSVGNDIKSFAGKSPDQCKTGCNENSGCDGFVFSNGTCYLKNSNMYPKSKRTKADTNTRMFKRNVEVDNDSSCSKKVNVISGNQWETYPKDTNKMTSTAKCNLALNATYTNSTSSSNNSLQELSNIIIDKLSYLNESDKKLVAKYGLTEKKIKDDLISFDLENYKLRQINTGMPTLIGMESSSEQEMISNSYKYMIWSILAIMIVIGGIKMSK